MPINDQQQTVERMPTDVGRGPEHDCYKLRSAAVAVNPQKSSGLRIVTVNSDQIVHVVGPVQKSGLVEVNVNGEPLQMFLRDLEQWGERVLTTRT